MISIKVNLYMAKIFITGANGFLGSNLVEYLLDAGHDVIAVIRPGCAHDKLSHLNCEIVHYDGTISSLKAHLDANTTIVHTASYYVAEHKEEDIPMLLNSNLQYGLNLLEAMRVRGAKKIVNIGTAWQGYKGQERRPVNLYAATKQAFEDFITYYCDAEGFRAISLRLNDTYGEKDQRMKLVKLLINAGLTKTTLDMSAGEQYINLSHISDVCGAIDASIRNIPESNSIEIYNLINKDEYTIKDLVKIIEDELKITVPVNFGARDYRAREVMEPLKTNKLKFYEPSTDLRIGIQKIYKQLNDK